MTHTHTQSTHTHTKHIKTHEEHIKWNHQPNTNKIVQALTSSHKLSQALTSSHKLFQGFTNWKTRKKIELLSLLFQSVVCAEEKLWNIIIILFTLAAKPNILVGRNTTNFYDYCHFRLDQRYSRKEYIEISL